MFSVFVLAALVVSASADAGTPGGYSPVENVAAGSHADALAAYAVSALKTNSNSLDLAQLEFDKVLSAQQQVVAGVNHQITAKLTPHGQIKLTIFEQSWTKTLEVSEATLTPSDVALAQVSLVNAENKLTLDTAELERYAAARAAAAAPASAEKSEAPAQGAKAKVSWKEWLKSKLRRRARA